MVDQNDQQTELPQEEPGWLGSVWADVQAGAQSLGNDLLIIREDVMNVGATVIGSPGYIADLADAGVEALGGNLYDGSAGGYIATNVRDGMTMADPLRLIGVEARIETEQQQALRDGSAFAGEVAFMVGTLGSGAAIRAPAYAGRFGRAAMVAEEGGDMLGRISKTLRSIFGRNADDAARAAAPNAGATAAATADNAAAAVNPLRATHNFMMGANTRYVSIGIPAALATSAVAYNIAENETAGGVSAALIDGAVNAVHGAINVGLVDAENLESAINVTTFIGNAMTSIDQSAQNQAVGVFVVDPETASPEDIAAGQNASLAWLLTPHNAAVLLAKNAARHQLVDHVIDDPQEADRYLAENFINDIVVGAEAAALGEHQVTEEHVRAMITEAMADPGQHPYLSRVLATNDGRLMNGLRQMWPELENVETLQPSPETARDLLPEAMTRARDTAASTLEETAQQWAQNPQLAFAAPFLSILVAIGNFIQAIADIFSGNDVMAQSDNPARLQALGAMVGSDPNAVARIDHSGHAAPNPVNPGLRQDMDFAPA